MSAEAVQPNVLEVKSIFSPQEGFEVKGYNAFDAIMAAVELEGKKNFPQVSTTLTRVRGRDKKRLDLICHINHKRELISSIKCSFRLRAVAQNADISCAKIAYCSLQHSCQDAEFMMNNPMESTTQRPRSKKRTAVEFAASEVMTNYELPTKTGPGVAKRKGSSSGSLVHDLQDRLNREGLIHLSNDQASRFIRNKKIAKKMEREIAAATG